MLQNTDRELYLSTSPSVSVKSLDVGLAGTGGTLGDGDVISWGSDGPSRFVKKDGNGFCLTYLDGVSQLTSDGSRPLATISRLLTDVDITSTITAVV